MAKYEDVLFIFSSIYGILARPIVYKTFSCTYDLSMNIGVCENMKIQTDEFFFVVAQNSRQCNLF